MSWHVRPPKLISCSRPGHAQLPLAVRSGFPLSQFPCMQSDQRLIYLLRLRPPASSAWQASTVKGWEQLRSAATDISRRRCARFTCPAIAWVPSAACMVSIQTQKSCITRAIARNLVHMLLLHRKSRVPAAAAVTITTVRISDGAQPDGKQPLTSRVTNYNTVPFFRLCCQDVKRSN